MLTGRGDVDAKSEAFRAGADDYLVKRIVPEELVARAVRALERNYGVRPTVRRSEAAPAPAPEPALSVTITADADETMDAMPAPATLASDEPGVEPARFGAAPGEPAEPALDDAAIAVELAAAVADADAASLVPAPPVPAPSVLPPVEPPPVRTATVVPAAVPPLLAPSTSEPRSPAFLSSRPSAPPQEQPAPPAAPPTITRQNAWSKFLGRSRPT
jgi:hypothetical protein